MARLEQYRQLIQELLNKYTEIDFNNPELETELLFDLQRDRYQVVYVG